MSKATATEQFQALLSEQSWIICAAWPYLAGYVAVLTAGGVYGDVINIGDSIQVLYNLVILTASYVLVVAMIGAAELAPRGSLGGFWIYFCVGLLSSLATVVGLLALVVPGIVLTIRWAPAYGYALIDRNGVTESLMNSWDNTRPFALPILLALLPCGAAFIGGIAIFELLAVGSYDPYSYNWVWGLLANLLMNLGAAAYSALGLAIHSYIGRQDDGLAGLFEEPRLTPAKPRPHPRAYVYA